MHERSANDIKMRYFLINYKAKTIELTTNPQKVEKSLCFSHERFPSYILIIDAIGELTHNTRKIDRDSVFITNIFEFQSRQDYEDFKLGSKIFNPDNESIKPTPRRG